MLLLITKKKRTMYCEGASHTKEAGQFNMGGESQKIGFEIARSYWSEYKANIIMISEYFERTLHILSHYSPIGSR